MLLMMIAVTREGQWGYGKVIVAACFFSVFWGNFFEHEFGVWNWKSESYRVSVQSGQTATGLSAQTLHY